MTNNIIIWPQGMRRDHCRYCGVPFNEIPESMTNPGVCEFCSERKSAIGEVHPLKSVYPFRYLKVRTTVRLSVRIAKHRHR